MIEELKQIITSSNPLYEVEYEENKMMNLKADEKISSARFAYIEEFVQGSYSKEAYFKKKTTQVQIYFCRFISEIDSTADQREAIRKEIETEVVLPFMEKYNESKKFAFVNSFKFFTPLPRFDSNEISIMLQFDCKQTMC